MDDQPVLQQIQELAHDEHALRTVQGQGQASADEVARLRDIEEQLDRCWDLLRQRRALRTVGGDPETAHARPVSQVEGYWQ